MSGTNLCVAKSLTIADATGASSFAIDVTEVTRGQYEAWTATSPTLPAKSDTDCGSTASYLEAATCMSKAEVCKTNCDHHPTVCVDWCSAQAYCKAVGKRLCGKVGGGANAFADQAKAEASQWYRACSSAGANAYPYGNVYSETACVGAGFASTSTTSTTTPVASVQTCQSSVPGYQGIFDLSGNVMEWEDSCASSGSSGGCRLRGGSFEENSNILECGYGFSYVRTTTNPRIGFRCCSQ
jgi:formylglycine-generating enzyme required for sulfatase activity